MLLPPFNSDGMLPPGDYALTLPELAASHLVTGEGAGVERWDGAWRAQLVSNLALLVRQLWAVGVGRIFIGGSFLQNKACPKDIDGYFHCDIFQYASQELQRQLNSLDPHQSWGWHTDFRVLDEKTGKTILPMTPRYHVELYPHPCLVHALHGPIVVRADGTGYRREDFLPELKRTLVELRVLSGWSQQEFAERLGIDETLIAFDEDTRYASLTLEKSRRIVETLISQIDLYPQKLRIARAQGLLKIRKSRGIIEIVRGRNNIF